MTCHYPGLRSASDWLGRKNILLQPIRSTTQIWVMTGHQYIISALVADTSFRRKPVMVSQKVGCSLRRKQTKPFAFVGSWMNDKTDDSFHGFSSSAASVSLGISLLFLYANNPNKIFMKNNKLRHGWAENCFCFFFFLYLRPLFLTESYSVWRHHCLSGRCNFVSFVILYVIESNS